jgi:arylsulfatase A-like enzyme
VFDAFSARHISTHGYKRGTTPNIARLAERAIVYHNHHAGGNFTTTGTGALLTGALPWRHRAFSLFSPVTESLADKSIFHAFRDYHRIAYSHNPAVVALLDQFSSALDENIPLEKFLLNSDEPIKKLFPKDVETALTAWTRAAKKGNGHTYSLFLSSIFEKVQKERFAPLADQFPRGMPSVYDNNYFTLEMVMDWLGSQAGEFPRPFFGYFHFIPPHDPYGTRADFVDAFKDDGFRPAEKPDDLFYIGPPADKMPGWRQNYDEFVLYVDSEFGRLFDRLEESGALEDTWVVLTSDHGELFERGIAGHLTPVLYEPVIHVPLMIFEPGRSTRTDIYAPTSAVDVYPTLLHMTGGSIPDGLEGLVLPPFSNAGLTSGRSIYAVHTKDTAPDEPLVKATLMQITGDYKLMYFTGYEELQGGERVELYHLAEDPEELNNLFSDDLNLGKSLLDELKAKLLEMNKPYTK